MYMEMNPPPVDLIRVPAFLGNWLLEIELTNPLQMMSKGVGGYIKI